MTSFVCALALTLAQAAPPDKSPTANNARNREANSAPTQEQELAKVKGGPATPQSEWKTGDSRGNPSPTARGVRQARGKRAKKPRPVPAKAAPEKAQ